MPPEVSPPASIIPNKVVLFRVFFFGAFLFLLYQLFLVFAPFLTALMSAATLVLIFHPVHAWLVRRLRGRHNLAAAVGTIGILLIVILPILLLTWLVAREAVDVLPRIRDWLALSREGSGSSLEQGLPPKARELIDRADAFFASWGLDVHALFTQALDAVGTKIQEIAPRLLANLLPLLLDLAIVVIGAFFFLRDGGRMVRGVIGYVPMEEKYKTLVLARLDETFSAVVRGVFITATVQAVMVGVGCAIGGLRFAALLGFATAFMALIPFFGAAGVWIPTCVISAVTGDWRAFWCVLAFGLAASTTDNFLKPWIMGERTQIPTFLMFFGILGGLEVYGFLGIFIGPLMIGLLLTFAKIYREQFQSAPAVSDVSKQPAPSPAPSTSTSPRA